MKFMIKIKKTIGIILTLAITASLCSCFKVTIIPGGQSNPINDVNGETYSSEESHPSVSGESDSVSETESQSAPAPSDAPESSSEAESSSVPDEPSSEAAPVTPDKMSSEELLAFFNSAVNRVKDEKIGFKKSKLTSVIDIQLSNSAANTLVGLIKSSLLSETADETTVKKGESGIDVMSPSGKTYAGTLNLNDITSINCTSSGGEYVINVAVKGETNPSDGGSMSRVFDFITVDDVVNIYAPKVNATVSKDDIEVVFSGCTATLKVDAAGTVRSYSTVVNCVINMYNASIKRVVTINSDLALSLSSTTDYTDFAY